MDFIFLNIRLLIETDVLSTGLWSIAFGEIAGELAPKLSYKLKTFICGEQENGNGSHA
jgi:hypothetical protein